MSRASSEIQDGVSDPRSSPKISALADLRNEVNQLRLENKELARQLHADRYVARQRTQRVVSDLRSSNIRVERETASIRERFNSRNDQIEALEATARAKMKEANIHRLQSQKFNKQIEEVKTEIEATKRACAEVKADLDEKNGLIEIVKEKIRKVKETRDEDDALSNELKEAIHKTKTDIKKLQDHHSMQLKEAKRYDEANENLKKEMSRAEETIEHLTKSLKDTDVENKSLEMEIMKTSAEIKRMKEKQLTDSAQCSTLLSILQHRPNQSKLIQTEPIVLNHHSGEAIDKIEMSHHENCDRGTIVRVSGIGGNAKQKFGKDLEVRATSYSRHVNFNVKLNK